MFSFSHHGFEINQTVFVLDIKNESDDTVIVKFCRPLKTTIVSFSTWPRPTYFLRGVIKETCCKDPDHNRMSRSYNFSKKCLVPTSYKLK